LTNNPRLLVGLSALHSALFPIPVVTLFWTEQIGMSLTDVMTLQAGFSVAVVLCEFPSGYLADRIGYRASLVIGGVGWLAGWLVYAWASSFGAVMLAEVILGVGLAFMSGADRALLWASLEATGRADQYTRWDGPGLPFWLEIPVAALGLTSIVALREIPRPARTPHRSHLERAWHVLRFALGHNARLRAGMALSVALGLSSFVMVWVIQPYMRGRGMPPTWFGPVWACARPCSAAAC